MAVTGREGDQGFLYTMSALVRENALKVAEMDSSIVIRLAVERDAPTIANFMQRMSLETENISLDAATVLEGVKTALNCSQHGFYVVAEVSNDIVGCLMITTEWSDWRNGLQWWIQSVYVAIEHRRRGIYNAMHAFVKDLALQDGNVVGLRLYVERDNERAKAIYRKLGMKQTKYLVFEEPLVVPAG